MTTHETHQAMLEAAEAALSAAHTRRAKLVALRAQIVTETANNELAMFEARAKLKATKKYIKEWDEWISSSMRANPGADYDQIVRSCPILPPQ
jgi:uncharacterized protein YegL